MARKTVADRGTIKDPEEWTTGNEPMTGAQESYLHTLAREAGEEIKEDLTKAEASEKIGELQKETGRGAAAPKTRPRKKASGRKGSDSSGGREGDGSKG